jgi:hypothetical protein
MAIILWSYHVSSSAPAATPAVKMSSAAFFFFLNALSA